jgi:hypothetical protein
MIQFNFLTTAVAALIPLVIGFIWYGPLLFKKAWMKEVGFNVYINPKVYHYFNRKVYQ